jgi:hypothetical protein
MIYQTKVPKRAKGKGQRADGSFTLGQLPGVI